jgi:hypothetical protein
MPIVRIDNPDTFVGMEMQAAKAEIIERGYECRIVHVDGRTITWDLKPDYDPLRVNLHIKQGKVIKAAIG